MVFPFFLSAFVIALPFRLLLPFSSDFGSIFSATFILRCVRLGVERFLEAFSDTHGEVSEILL